MKNRWRQRAGAAAAKYGSAAKLANDNGGG